MRAEAQDTAILSAIGTGTGNDFIKYDKYAHSHGSSVKCDIIKYGDRYYINILNIGFDCTVVQKTETLKKKPLISGSFAYICGVVGTVFGEYGTKMHITVLKEDGETEEFSDDFMLCVVANGQYYGGGFKPAPLADITDGAADVVLVKKVKRTEIPSIIGLYKKGEHIDKEKRDIIDKFKNIMTYRRAKKVTITGIQSICADGEIEKRDKVDIEVVPKAINFMF